MVNRLLEILSKEEKALEVILKLLEDQYKKIIGKDIFGLESIVDEIKVGNKEVAQWEVERRKLLGQRNINDVVAESSNKNLEILFRRMKALIEEIKVQKETNELLIKQNLSYTNKLLTLINPVRETNLYNSYGAMKR